MCFNKTENRKRQFNGKAIKINLYICGGFLGGSVIKTSPASAGVAGDMGSPPG